MKGRLTAAVARAMADDGRGTPVPLALLLSAAARLYGLGVRMRSIRYRRPGSVRRLPCRVISIGNLTVGGTGKTPMTLWLAARLREAGHRVAVVSRGYGGGAERRSGVVSDGREIRMGTDDAGDEPFMMATRLPGVPVLVGRDRYGSGMRAVRRFGSRVILLDDGFQHRRLARDLDLVLLDAARPFGNGRLLPRGPLREPPEALSRADGIVLTRWAEGGSPPPALGRYAPSVPVFTSAHAPYAPLFLPAGQLPPAVRPGPINPREVLRGRRVMGVSGIARNDAFAATLRDFGADRFGFLGFPDHHRYTGADLQQVVTMARHIGADLLATTEKDWVRLADRSPWPLDLLVLGVRFDPGRDGNALLRLATGEL